MSSEKIVQTYGKRWDIEVFFKMAKHYLKLEKEMQMRDYDGLISHTTIESNQGVKSSFGFQAALSRLY